MGLFKKMTDPSPGGGLTGDDPDAERRAKAREAVRLSGQVRSTATSAREVDTTRLVMAGIPARARIDALHPTDVENDLQATFDVELTVFAEDGEFSARVIQPVAEEYVAAATAGADVAVKYDADDRGAVWIDWAASAAG